jgi:hypothetical protein
MRKLILWAVAIKAAGAAVTSTGGHSQAGVIALTKALLPKHGRERVCPAAIKNIVRLNF